MKNNENIIKIECNFADKVAELLKFTANKSDLYEDFYSDIWFCLDFDSLVVKGSDTYNKNYDIKYLIITKSDEDKAEKFCENFHGMTNKEIIEYLQGTVNELIDLYPDVFQQKFTEYELDVLSKCIYDWDIELPKLTHEELVKIIGYDFEYITEK